MSTRPLFLVLFLAATAFAPTLLAAQTGPNAPELTMRCDPPAGSLSRLTKAQKKTFMHSQDILVAGHFAEAVTELRSLLAQLPPNTLEQTATAERTAEAAIEAGDQTYAISLLKPIEERDGNDCAPRTLLARADAETGKSAERDTEISTLTALHNQDPKSPAGKLDGFELEKHILKGGGGVAIGYFLHPVGAHNTHLTAEIADASGAMVLRIELDSDDPDQVDFKQTHPDLPAKGERRYSLDAFASDKLLHDTKADHHALIQFYDGVPSYDILRGRILAIADATQNSGQNKSP
jgi:hypothetical protein